MITTRIVIFFADGDKMDTTINAEEGCLNFAVQPDCAAITRVWIQGSGSAIEPVFPPGTRPGALRE